jgi:hypothetical protein
LQMVDDGWCLGDGGHDTLITDTVRIEDKWTSKPRSAGEDDPRYRAVSALG